MNKLNIGDKVYFFKYVSHSAGGVDWIGITPLIGKIKEVSKHSQSKSYLIDYGGCSIWVDRNQIVTRKFFYAQQRCYKLYQQSQEWKDLYKHVKKMEEIFENHYLDDTQIVLADSKWGENGEGQNT